MRKTLRRFAYPLSILGFILITVGAEFPDAQLSHREIIHRYHVIPTDAAQMDLIAKTFEVVEKTQDGYEVLVLKERMEDFVRIAPQARLIEKDINAFLHTFAGETFAGYRSFAQIQSELKALESKHPGIAKLEQYGTSSAGNPLLALKVSDNPELDEVETEIMLTAATHGDELITVEVLMNVLDHLLTAYEARDQRAINIVENREIFFIPVVSPDSFIRKARYVDGVDPNRDFPWPSDPGHSSTPAIQGLIEFFAKHDIKASIDFHAFGQMIMYPWAYTLASPKAEDKAQFDRITGTMARLNNYVYGQISKVIYVAQGSSADYFYWKNNSFSLGIEMATTKVPPASQIPRVTKEILEPTLKFLESF